MVCTTEVVKVTGEPAALLNTVVGTSEVVVRVMVLASSGVSSTVLDSSAAVYHHTWGCRCLRDRLIERARLGYSLDRYARGGHRIGRGDVDRISRCLCHGRWCSRSRHDGRPNGSVRDVSRNRRDGRPYKFQH